MPKANKVSAANSVDGANRDPFRDPTSVPPSPTAPEPPKPPTSDPEAGPSQHRGNENDPLSPHHSPPSTAPATSQRPLSPIPNPPTFSAPDDTENAAIQASLKRRRRHHRPAILRSHSSDSTDSYDADAEAAQLADDTEQYEKAYRHIDLEVDGRVLQNQAELPPIPKAKVAHYAWEVMYENQRGVSMFGKSWYSSNSLQPWDPTTFTLPLTVEGDFILERPKVTDTPALQELDAGDDGADADQSETNKEPAKRKKIKTGYNLSTYQTPSPQWVWMTPWMTNMRVDTDQQGWRYNLWFHTKSWVPHPRRFNWWGWVRRREWVRLRALLPPEPELLDNYDDEDEVKEPTSLDEVLDSDRPIANMARHLASKALDREKLALWDRWVSQGTVEARHCLASLFDDQEKLVFIARAFLYPAARKTFYRDLVKRGIVEKKTDCLECAEYDLYVIQ